MKPETAGGRLLLPLLLAAVLTGTRAHPVPGDTRLPPDAKECHLARFKSLAPQELTAFRKARDAIEEWLLKKDVKCSSRLFPRCWDLQQLQVQERPKALQADLALTLEVLENVTDSALGPILHQPLHTLRHIQSQLQACVQERPKALQADLALTLEVLENVTDSALGPILHQPLHTLRHIQSQLQACTQSQPTAEPGSPSHRLSRWLHKLQEAQEKETPGCLEASVTSNLMRLLLRDLKCVEVSVAVQAKTPQTMKVLESGGVNSVLDDILVFITVMSV
ncbi:Interferon lambda-2 [Microtus ochrogaster]|uniref:Interferon lambda-2 n=1 Tax=Microtus ochrogaster TaxID=79684 RepID=A0A8J6GL11_MICOH|nr:Interferon lambda-2 [Microtus ochrogaster]